MTQRLRLAVLGLAFASAGCLIVLPQTWTWRIHAMISVNFAPFVSNSGRMFWSEWDHETTPAGGTSVFWGGGPTERNGYTYCANCRWGDPAVWKISWSEYDNLPCHGDYEYINITYQDTAPMLCINIKSSFFGFEEASSGTLTYELPEWFAAEDYTEPPGPGDSGTMDVDQALYSDDYVDSDSGQYRLLYQSDGNLVLYDTWDSWAPVWGCCSVNNDPGRAHMQSDGNFVVYDGQEQPIWDSGTVGYYDAYLVVTDEGHIVVLSDGGFPLWWNGY